MGTPQGHLRPPWLLVLLLGVAGAAATQQIRVLGESVLFSLALPPDKVVTQIDWSFGDGTEGTKIQLAEVFRGGFRRPDPNDRFGNRLQVTYDTLRIATLERGDSGTYWARVKMYPSLLEDRIFTLSVYDAVAQPQIERHLLSLTPQECNLTLRCQVPLGSDANVAWQLGGSAGVARGQLCGDNQTLCLALPVTALNSTYTCLAWNPAQERNVTVHPLTLCQLQVPGRWHRTHLWVALLVLVMVIGALLGIAWICRRRRRSRKAEGGAPTPLPSPDPPPELLYSEVQSRDPPEPRQGQDQPRTIYCQLRAQL